MVEGLKQAIAQRNMAGIKHSLEQGRIMGYQFDAPLLDEANKWLNLLEHLHMLIQTARQTKDLNSIQRAIQIIDQHQLQFPEA